MILIAVALVADSFGRLFGADIPLVAETPSFMFGATDCDLTAVSDPNGALHAAVIP